MIIHLRVLNKLPRNRAPWSSHWIPQHFAAHNSPEVMDHDAHSLREEDGRRLGVGYHEGRTSGAHVLGKVNEGKDQRAKKETKKAPKRS